MLDSHLARLAKHKPVKSRLLIFGLCVATLLSGAIARAETRDLRIMSQNLWMLSLDSRAGGTADERVKILLKVVREASPDIITFSEVWGADYRTAVKNSLTPLGYQCEAKSDLPLLDAGREIGLGLGAGASLQAFLAYRSRKKSCEWSYAAIGIAAGATVTAGLAATFFGADQGIVRNFGDGLLVCSKFALKESQVFHFKNTVGSFSDKQEEMFLFRGAIRAVYEVPGIGPVEVYTTHLGPRRYHEETGTYAPEDSEQNKKQTLELVDWIRKTHKGKTPMFLTGDMNFNYQQITKGKWDGQPYPAYEILTDSPRGLGLIDTFRKVRNYGSPQKLRKPMPIRTAPLPQGVI